VKINFGRLLLQTARQFSDRQALVNVERVRTFTFMELHLLTNKICNLLRDRFGLARGDVYANLLENDNMGLLHFWMFKAEASGAWLNYRDSYDEHMWQIDLIRPRLVFMEASLIGGYYDPLRERGIEIVCMDPPAEQREGVHNLWDLLEEASDAETGVEHDGDEHIALYRFTGGTTGKGKCAMYTLNSLMRPMYGFYSHPEDLIPRHARHLHVTPLSHASSLFVLPFHFKGGTQVTMNLPDLHGLCEHIQNERVTSTLLVPTLLYRFLEFDVEERFDLSSLDTVFYGASPMSPDKLKGLQAKFGNIFVQMYGATEAFPPVAILGKAEHRLESAEDLARLGSAGKPVAGYEVMMVDEAGREVSAGETGEAWLRGPGIIKGYFKNAEQTEAEFTEDGWWKSGDMMFMDPKGYIYIVDRKKDMIISGGFNVYATEVEEALNAHPAVLMSAVIGIPHEEWGEAVHADVILKEGGEMDPSELIAFCKERKGKYKAPKTIAFVEELPVSTVGKILRRKVREKYWKGQERQVH